MSTSCLVVKTSPSMLSSDSPQQVQLETSHLTTLSGFSKRVFVLPVFLFCFGFLKSFTEFFLSFFFEDFWSVEGGFELLLLSVPFKSLISAFNSLFYFFSSAFSFSNSETRFSKLSILAKSFDTRSFNSSTVSLPFTISSNSSIRRFGQSFIDFFNYS